MAHSHLLRDNNVIHSSSQHATKGRDRLDLTFLEPQTRVLEIGAGTGDQAFKLKQRSEPDAAFACSKEKRLDAEPVADQMQRAGLAIPARNAVHIFESPVEPAPCNRFQDDLGIGSAAESAFQLGRSGNRIRIVNLAVVRG